MAESCIPVDLFNPGQAFACLGLMEAAEILQGNARATFNWKNDQSPTFHLVADGEAEPIGMVLNFLKEARVEACVPKELWESQEVRDWGQKRGEESGFSVHALEARAPFPYDPSHSRRASKAGAKKDQPEFKKDTLPARLAYQGKSLPIMHWGDTSSRDALKFWAGAGGMPGVAFVSRLLTLTRDKIDQYKDDPFSLSAPQESGLRFDWRKDYVPLDTGFSPNSHDAITTVGFPLVDILAAIGLGYARPERENNLNYCYGVIMGADALDPIFLRAALGARLSPVPSCALRRFRMTLGWPGQEGQARCIISASEIPTEGETP